MTQERKELISKIKALQIEKLQLEIQLNEERRKLKSLKEKEQTTKRKK